VILFATAYNRAYPTSCLRHSTQIPHYARNFRYAQPLYEMGIFENFRFFRYQFRIDGQILPLPKICPKKKVAEEKEFCFFLPVSPKKGKQARSAGNERQPKAG